MRVVWDLTGTSALPAGVTDIEVVTCENAGQADESCSKTACSVGAISPMPETEVPSCRPLEGTEMFEEPVLVRRDLPTGTPIRFELRGKAGQHLLHVGHAGPFVLGEGERRQVELRMYPVDTSSAVPGASVSRFLHTATRLPDGRVLIAGGFTEATAMAACPADVGADAQCFELVATDEALALDPTSGAVEPIRDAMLAPRAGHTATLLPDGRVLLAGGAARALLTMTPQGTNTTDGYELTLLPRRADGSDGAHDSFALFDAYLDGVDDNERAGDLGRGRFLGSAGGDTAGTLNQPRFLHAAAEVPGAPSRVLLVGGLGGPESAETWEVFDNQRTGGYGVYAGPDARLATARAMPSAVGVGERVWIFGGVNATSDDDLAAIWSAEGDDPNGAVTRANAITAFPSATTDGTESHPEYALLQPLVATVDSGARAVVAGWYGARCPPDGTTPSFAGTERCAEAGRSFTVADEDGLTTPTNLIARSFGAVATLGCFEPGRSERYVVMTGGIMNAAWRAQPAIDILTGTVDAIGAAERLSGVSASLTRPRLFHTTSGLPGLGFVTVGGITFSTALDQITFESTVEVTFLRRPDRDC